MAKTTICYWGPSLVTEQILKDYVDRGLLAAQEEIGWRLSQGEEVPNPNEGEVIVLLIIFSGALHRPGQNSFGMFYIILTSILKT
jgi:hypothetical protein